MIKNDENKLIRQPGWLYLLWPVCSHLSCSGVANSVIFRKYHFFGPAGCPVSKEAPTLPHCHKVLLVPLTQQFLFCRTADAHPSSSVAMGCPLPIQDFGFVFDEFSEVHVRPLLDFELSEQQLCIPAYTAASFTDFRNTQATPVVWIIAAKCADQAGSLECHTTHNQPAQTVDGNPLGPAVQAVFHPLLFHSSSL